MRPTIRCFTKQPGIRHGGRLRFINLPASNAASLTSTPRCVISPNRWRRVQCQTPCIAAPCVLRIGMVEKGRQSDGQGTRSIAGLHFPSRVIDQIVLEWALQQPGNQPVDDGALFATVFRNLGIATWNLHRDSATARQFYLRALELDVNDPRLVSEYDQPARSSTIHCQSDSHFSKSAWIGSCSATIARWRWRLCITLPASQNRRWQS